MNGGARAGECRCDIAAHVDLVLEGIGDPIDGGRESCAGRSGHPPAGSEPAQPGTVRIRGHPGNRIGEVANVAARCDP